jgi:ribose transport system permease protein
LIATIRQYATLAGFAGVVIVLWLLLPDTFITARNLLNVSQQISMLAVVAFTMTIVMAMGDFDLSVGSLASLAGITAAVLFTHDWPIAMALSAALTVGLCGGLLNGWLVSYVGILPFVATLGTLTIYSGAAFLVSGGKTIFGRDIPAAFGSFSRSGIPLNWPGYDNLRIPSLSIIALLVLLGVWFLLEKRTFGRHLYVIGNNKEAAHYAGIAVKRQRLIAFALTGLGAALAGLMLASRVASANPTQGAGLMLDGIAAVFLGMSLHRSGEPHVLGTLIGVSMLGLLDNGLTQLSVDSYVREILVGVILLIAVGFSMMTGKAGAQFK